MSKQANDFAGEVLLLSRIAHVVARTGLSAAGAMCGTFVAAQITRTDPSRFDSVGFILATILVGMIGFYLGIDIPRPRALPAVMPSRVDPVELLSATGTFLATIAALISVYAFVFDATPQRSFEYMVASWWIVGVVMQIGAGVTGRMWLVSKAL